MEELSPQRVVALLKDKGVEVSAEQAAAMLEVLRLLAAIMVAHYLDPPGNYSSIISEIKDPCL